MSDLATSIALQLLRLNKNVDTFSHIYTYHLFHIENVRSRNLKGKKKEKQEVGRKKQTVIL